MSIELAFSKDEEGQIIRTCCPHPAPNVGDQESGAEAVRSGRGFSQRVLLVDGVVLLKRQGARECVKDVLLGQPAQRVDRRTLACLVLPARGEVTAGSQEVLGVERRGCSRRSAPDQRASNCRHRAFEEIRADTMKVSARSTVPTGSR